MKETVFTCHDDRINRMHDLGFFTRLSSLLLHQLTGDYREFHGQVMTYNFFAACVYCNAEYNYQAEVRFDFDTQTATITINTPSTMTKNNANVDDYLLRAVRYLDRHHERIYKISSTELDTRTCTVSYIYGDIVVLFVLLLDEKKKLKTIVYKPTSLETYNDKTVFSFSLSNHRTKYRTF